MNAPIFLSAIFGVILLMLPNYSSSIINAALILIIGLGFFFPFFFSKKILNSASRFTELNHTFGKKFLTFHGIIFLFVFQIFALLCSVDFMLSQFFGEIHNLLLIATIVFSGFISVIGGSKIIQSINSAASMSLFVGLVIVLINRIFIHSPLFSIFNPALFQKLEFSSAVEISHINIFVGVVSLSLIIFWLMWLEPSEIQRKKIIQNSPLFLKSTITSSIFLVGVFVLFAKGFEPSNYTAASDGNIVTAIISLSLLGGLFGLFVATFHSIGSVSAFHLYPQFTNMVHREKQMLIEKLMTVFSVITTILFIPIIRNVGGAVITYYIFFLALFTAPIVVSFFISMALKKINPGVLSASIYIGEMYAILELMVYLTFGYSLVVDPPNIFFVSVASSIVTVMSYLIIDKARKTFFVKKVL